MYKISKYKASTAISWHSPIDYTSFYFTKTNSNPS